MNVDNATERTSNTTKTVLSVGEANKGNTDKIG